jgi:hypothetical protein
MSKETQLITPYLIGHLVGTGQALSSESRLVFEVSFQRHTSDTRSEPREFGLSICNIFDYAKATSVAFLQGNSGLEDIRVKAPSDQGWEPHGKT